MGKPNIDNKKKQLVLILIIFLFILLVITYFAYSYFAKNNTNATIKKEILALLKNNDISFFTENKLYNNIFERMEEAKFSSDSKIDLSSSMENNMFSNLDLSKFNFSYHLTKDNPNAKMYGQLITEYSGNHFLTLDLLANKNLFALKSDEIVNKYVGSDNENFQDVTSKIFEGDIEFSNLKKLKNFTLDREIIDFDKIVNSPDIEKYTDIFEKNVSYENFSKKDNVIVTLNSDQLNTTEYTIALNPNNTANVLNEISHVLEQSEGIIAELIVNSVENFDEEKSGILEYTDNDNTLQIPAEENNFNTSVTIWDGNTVPESESSNEAETLRNNVENTTVVNNTAVNATVENSTAVNNIPQNNTVSNNTISNNTAANETTEIHVNEVPSSNTVTNETTNSVTEQVQSTPSTVIEEITFEDTLPTPQSPSNNVNNNSNVNENYRTQGFIEVNENGEALGEDETVLVGADYQDTLKNISDISSKIDWTTYLFTGAKTNFSQEELIEKLEGILDNLIKSNSSLVIKMYVSDNKIVKINFEFPENEKSFDIEIISKSDSEKYLNMKMLSGNSNSATGYTVSIYKKQADADVKYNIAINRINKKKITKKTNMKIETKGMINSKKYTTDVDVSYIDNSGELKMTVSNILNFEDEIEIEDLNEDNCLFIDNLSDDELQMTYQAIKEKTAEVLKNKNRNLNIIEINNSNSIVEQNEVETDNNENAEEKENIKKALIEVISSKMRDYLSAGNELKLQDLENLEIEDYQTQITINSNLAVIIVNGYRFSLDSDFNLSY